jgi:hypothetical protein
METAINPRRVLFPVRLLMIESPKRETANISGGPNRRANQASGVARTMKATVLRIPATKPDQREIIRALRAKPFLARGYPSRQVTAAAAFPGMLMVMDVIDPPYSHPV